MNTQKGFIPVVVVIVITVISALVVSAAWYYEENKEEVVTTTNIVTNTVSNTTSNNNTNTTINTNTSTDETADWQTYTNNTYIYTLKYPEEFSIREDVSSVLEVVFGCNTGTECRDGVKVAAFDSLDDWKNSFDSSTILSSANTVVDGKSALRINYGEFGTSRVGVMYNEILYEIYGNSFLDNGLLLTFEFFKPQVGESVDSFCKRITESGEVVCPEDYCQITCVGGDSDTSGCIPGCRAKDCQFFSAKNCPLTDCAIWTTNTGDETCYYDRSNNPPECGSEGYYSQEVDCCEGLVRRSGKLLPDGSCDMAKGGYQDKFPYCLACGDGTCDEGFLENKCNCPEDCGS